MSEETRLTPETLKQARIFDKLPEAVFELAKSNAALSERVERLARINSYLIAIVVVALMGVGFASVTWGRATTKNIDDNTRRIDRLEHAVFQQGAP